MNEELNNIPQTPDENIEPKAQPVPEEYREQPVSAAAEETPKQEESPAYGAEYSSNNERNNAQPDYRSAYGSTYSPYGSGYSRNSYAGAAQNAQNAPFSGYSQNTPGGGVYYGGTASQTPTDAKKKKDKKNGNRAIAWMVALCIICSSVFGCVGVFVGAKLFGGNNTVGQSNASGEPVNYVTGETLTPKDSDGTVVTAAQIASDSVVEITTEKISYFFGEYISSGAGSGVIVDTDGYIITCAHVVDGASSVTVKLTNGDTHAAEIIGSDTQTDIAVLKIEATGLKAASIGDSDKVVVGETAIAIGNPLGSLGGTVTSGHVSALNREITIDGQKYSLLQTDASINPGNSGGGLFDIDGNLIGIVNAKSSGSSSDTTIEGLGFAIPINSAVDIATQLVEKGYVGGRVNLGIYVCEVDESTSMTSLYQSGYASLMNYITDYGVYFLEYQSGQNGDLLFGDRIIAIDDVSVSSRSDILSLLEEYEIGDTVTVSVSRLNSDMRRSQVVDVSVTLVEQVPDTATEEPQITE